MIEKHLSKLSEELTLGTLPPIEKDGSVNIVIASFPVKVKIMDLGAHLSALIAPLPTKEKEEFLLKVMQANFLGQGTGGAVLGLQEDESFLTLSLSLPYEMDYTTFKEMVETFINFLDYWKTETANADKLG